METVQVSLFCIEGYGIQSHNLVMLKEGHKGIAGKNVQGGKVRLIFPIHMKEDMLVGENRVSEDVI